MNKNDLNICRIIVGILLIASVLLNIYYYRELNSFVPSEKVTMVEKIDTIKDTILTVKYEKYLDTIHDTLNHVEVIHDSLFIDGDTIISEKLDTIPVNVEVPITQKEYSDDSTYTAWVSGYRPMLDSINVRQKTIYVDREKTIIKKDNKRFGIGPVVYGGYDCQNKRFGWGVGIGVTYNLIRW